MPRMNYSPEKNARVAYFSPKKLKGLSCNQVVQSTKRVKRQRAYHLRVPDRHHVFKGVLTHHQQKSEKERTARKHGATPR